MRASESKAMMAASAGVVWLASVLAASAARAGPAILPSGSTVAGETLPQYTARWWQSALQVPYTTQSPLTDPTGARASRGDVGPVTFLYGGSSPDPVTNISRSATIRDDFVFFPVLNAFFTKTSLDDPATTEADLRAMAVQSIDEARSLYATIDGVPVPQSELLEHREASPVFTLDLPADNIFSEFGLPAEHIDLTVSDGYWLMLEPLGPGRHTLAFGGQFGPSFNSTLNVTYDLNVVPLPAPVAMALTTLPLAAAFGWRAMRRLDAE